MKIALLTEKYTPDIGGLAISSERIARMLTAAGQDVRVFCPSPNLSPSEKRTLLSGGIRVTRFGPHKRIDDTLIEWFELIVQEHKHEPFDVFHAYFLTQAGFIATLAGKYLHMPSVVSIRGNDIDRAAFDPGKFSHFMYALQNASAVTTNAEILARKAEALEDREIFLIPNGIDVDHFRPMERNSSLAESLERSFPRNAAREGGQNGSHLPVIGFVGELRRKKGMKTVLSAFTQVFSKRPSTLLIVGTIRQGEDREFFEEFKLDNPGLRIYVTGFISPADLPAYYSLIDVFVHPSLRDGMPNAVLEAMACGKAVIATPVGGVPELVNDGETGILIPTEDSNSLSASILSLLDDPDKCARLGKSARETVAARFPLQKELEGNLDVYRKLGLNP